MSHEDECVDAMREGAAARRAGVPRWPNPLGSGTREGRSWLYGWRVEDRWIADELARIKRAAVPEWLEMLERGRAAR